MSKHLIRSTTVQGILVMVGALIAPHLISGFDGVFLTVGLFGALWAFRGRLEADTLLHFWPGLPMTPVALQDEEQVKKPAAPEKPDVGGKIDGAFKRSA